MGLKKGALTNVTLKVFILVLSLSASAIGLNGDTKVKEVKFPVAVKSQPIPFSHKKHAFILCSNCHTGATRKERAGLPDTALCMMCHAAIKAESKAIQTLRTYYESGKKVEWVRIYTVPDFVFFSHATHHQAGIVCVECHGSVNTRDVLAREKPTDMVSCMKCHMAKKASTDCALCHVLGH